MSKCDPNRTRALRAPGLNEPRRAALRRRWERAGRRCVYCGGAPETVDHVVPLIRGGTNYEGNLAPACRVCNGTKRDRFITEWRLGRVTVEYSRIEPPRRRGVPKRRVSGVQMEIRVCSVCGGLHSSRAVTCSAGCATERGRRTMRDKYRRAVGIPLDLEPYESQRRPRVSHCGKGHEYTPENTYTGKSGRRCKQCTLLLNAESRARRAARSAA